MAKDRDQESKNETAQKCGWESQMDTFFTMLSVTQAIVFQSVFWLTIEILALTCPGLVCLDSNSSVSHLQ